MTAIIIVTVLYAIAFFALWTYYFAPKFKKGRFGDENAVYIIILTVISALVHIIGAVKYQGHSTDMSCFGGWSDMVFNGGMRSFYTSDAFHDYPPGYMYVLYVIGAIKHLLNPSDGALWLLIKSPAIICDLVTGYLIYKIARKKFGDKISAAAAGAYLLNPTIILNSAVWGQVDSVYTLFAALMVWFLTERKTIASYFAFAVCIFIKPQAFMFTPLIIFGIAENVFLPKFNREKFIKDLVCGLGAILMLVLLALPFGLKNVVSQYTQTLASYPYLTVNAFNLWGALGQNWTELNTATSVLGYIILAAIVAYSAYFFFKSKSEGKYYFTAAILSFATFMLSTKMHDRYAFPTMVFLLLTFVSRPNVKTFSLYAISTITQFFNTAWVLFIYEQDINKYFKSPVIATASIINLIFFVYFMYEGKKQFTDETKDEKPNPVKKEVPKKTDKKIHFKISEKHDKLTRFDYGIMAALMIIYGAVAFYHLGDTKAPQTFINIGNNNTVEIDLGHEAEISKLKFYLGSYQLDENRLLNITYCNEDGNEITTNSLDSGAVFYWSETEADVNARYIRLSTNGTDLSVMELGIIGTDGAAIMPKNVSSPEISVMFDEQDMIPERTTYLNSTYFDEIYHARTGYEFVHSLDVYEWTHPPLGKDIIALGIKIFGMTPFGWRFMGTLFGVFMIPVIYIFARRMLKHKWLAAVTAVLFTFDFMHFAQTRISTIDVYVTFFIMLMYYFMYKYYTMSFYDTPLKKTLIPLALSGICMGLGVASKWTGIYAGVGLGIIFFLTVYKRYSEYLFAKADPNGQTDGISHKQVTKLFSHNLRVTIVWCCIFFVFVPAAIYCLSYIPYLKAPSSQGFKTIIDNQNSIYAYHAKTVVESTHPFSSKWYEWIIMKRPIWYYSGTISDTVKEGISSFGNPLVWWVGIPALVLTVYRCFTKKDMKSWFLVIAYAIQIAFWIPVTRTTFIYHYFPCVPFLVLMIGLCIKEMYDEAATAKGQKAVVIGSIIYAAAVVGMFIMFYPVLSGAPCNVEYANTFLKWFDSWILL